MSPSLMNHAGFEDNHAKLSNHLYYSNKKSLVSLTGPLGHPDKILLHFSFREDQSP